MTHLSTSSPSPFQTHTHDHTCTHTHTQNTDGVERLLVGNKCDSSEQRVITEDMGKVLARDHSIPFIEASAKTGLNINEVRRGGKGIMTPKIKE